MNLQTFAVCTHCKQFKIMDKTILRSIGHKELVDIMYSTYHSSSQTIQNGIRRQVKRAGVNTLSNNITDNKIRNTAQSLGIR
jgi:flavorubredoxin